MSELFIYISGAPPGTIIYVDDVVLKAAPINNLDADEDGIQDSWEIFYYGTTETISDETDYNNNSINDGLEFWQTTYGDGIAFMPVSSSLSILNSQLNISWQGKVGMPYKILKTTNLTSQSWHVGENFIIGNGEQVSIEIPMTNNVEFIRVEVDQ
jgi:hypothetical protein